MANELLQYSYLPLFQGRVKNRLVTEYYVQSILKELGLHKLRTFPLKIRFSKTITDDAVGLCEGSKKYAVVSIATQCPETGHPLTYLEMMKTLTHELVHARQFIRGQLTGIGVWKWKGRNADNYNYENQPWEKEANRLEETLFSKCFPIYLTFNQ